jgi:hypothetical protein
MGFMDRKECNIEEVMAKFHFINEVVFWGGFDGFFTKYFIVKSRRKIWATPITIERKL